MKIKQLILSITIVIIFISCGDTKSSEIEAEFAKANIKTAQGFLGSDYKVINTADNNITSSNAYHEDSGTKREKFKVNEQNKTYTQNYVYTKYQNMEYDSICDIYRTTVINGDLFCSGDYYEKVGTNYKFSNKLCRYENNFISKFLKYENGSTKYYDYINNIRIKNITYTNTSTNEIRRKENWKYTYTKDKSQKLITIDYLEGKYYFDNLKQYLIISKKVYSNNVETKFDLCTDDIYSGILYMDTVDTTIKFDVISTNIIRVSKLINETTMVWEEIAIFEKK